MKKATLIITLGFLSYLSIAQKSQRFKNEVFSAIDSLKNIPYGEAKNINGDSEKLLLDIYSPASDTLKKRPLIVFIHGGGFVNGDKATGYPMVYTVGFAKRGYVSSSINYRLGVEGPKSKIVYFEAMYRAVQDAKAAIRFFRKNAEKYGIDTSKIYVAGGSAGAMTALQLAYLDQNEVPNYINTSKLGSLEGSSGNEGFSSKVSGVINCWGAMIDYKWINSGDVPFFNVHGTGDKTVPFDSTFDYNGFKYGSKILYNRGLSLGIPVGLKLYENAGHTLDSDKNRFKNSLDEIGFWLYSQLNKAKNSEGVLRFEKEIQEFEKSDKTISYSSNAILVTGSSYIRLWKNIQQDLAPHEIIHRGFGGSNIVEMSYYIDRIIAKHDFKAIAFYSGSNDITDSKLDKTPTQVLEAFKYIVEKVRQKHPKTPIYYIAISPNERRWAVQDKIVEANELLKNYCQTTPNLHFIETMQQLLGKDGKYQPEMYINDKLHFNEKGYKIWTEIIKGVFDKDFAFNSSSTLLLDELVIAKNLKTIKDNSDPSKIQALKNLIKSADKILKEGKLYSVMHKKQTPPSGDKHDYMSTGPYWWPDPSKPNGLPYIRKDGERNPEYYEITDSDEMDKVEDETETLALAYYYSKDERYAEHASRIIKVWFLDKETRQNPNLNFGQGIPGINTGRGIGLIETRELNRVIDAAILLQNSKSWSKEDHEGLKKWFAEFLAWMKDSPLGIDEADEHNNHGTYYDVQFISYALFIGRQDLAKSQLEITKKRIESQIKPDGSQPHELERTTSWGYVNMNLSGFFKIAQLAEHLNVDLWSFHTADGKNLQKCVDWMLPYLKNEKAWEYKQIKKIEYSDTVNILKTASKVYSNSGYDKLAKEIDPKTYTSDFGTLTF
jgi:hypothetical protein